MQVGDLDYFFEGVQFFDDVGQVDVIVYVDDQLDYVDVIVVFVYVDFFDVVVGCVDVGGEQGDQVMLVFQFDVQFDIEFVGDIFGLVELDVFFWVVVYFVDVFVVFQVYYYVFVGGQVVNDWVVGNWCVVFGVVQDQVFGVVDCQWIFGVWCFFVFVGQQVVGDYVGYVVVQVDFFQQVFEDFYVVFGEYGLDVFLGNFFEVVVEVGEGFVQQVFVEVD